MTIRFTNASASINGIEDVFKLLYSDLSRYSVDELNRAEYQSSDFGNFCASVGNLHNANLCRRLQSKIENERSQQIYNRVPLI